MARRIDIKPSAPPLEKFYENESDYHKTSFQNDSKNSSGKISDEIFNEKKSKYHETSFQSDSKNSSGKISDERFNKKNSNYNETSFQNDSKNSSGKISGEGDALALCACCTLLCLTCCRGDDKKKLNKDKIPQHVFSSNSNYHAKQPVQQFNPRSMSNFSQSPSTIYNVIDNNKGTVVFQNKNIVFQLDNYNNLHCTVLARNNQELSQIKDTIYFNDFFVEVNGELFGSTISFDGTYYLNVTNYQSRQVPFKCYFYKIIN